MSAFDELAEILGAGQAGSLAVGIGVIRSWDPTTFENTVDYHGTRLDDVGIGSGIDAYSYRPNDLVVVYSWHPGGSASDLGIGSYWLGGRVVPPGTTDAGALRLRGGSLVLDDGMSLLVEGGSIESRYPTGGTAARFGPLFSSVTGDPSGRGLLVQGSDVDTSNILRARETVEGDRQVIIGATPAPDKAVDRFSVWSRETRIWSYGGDTVIAEQSGTAGFGGVGGTMLIPAGGGPSANVHMDTSSGLIRFVSSTERDKRDITDLDIDPETVLRMRPRSWVHCPAPRPAPEWSACDEITGVEPDPDAPRHVGFVAEELDALGMGLFVARDAEGRPDGIHYDRLTAALIPLLQRQQTQIDQLTARLDALEARP